MLGVFPKNVSDGVKKDLELTHALSERQVYPLPFAGIVASKRKRYS